MLECQPMVFASPLPWHIAAAKFFGQSASVFPKPAFTVLLTLCLTRAEINTADISKCEKEKKWYYEWDRKKS